MRLNVPALLAGAAAASAAAAGPSDTFRESLTLHPLPDGKLSVLFEFTTHFSLHHGANDGSRQSHHSLTPPGLLLPLERNNVSELTVSFSSGQWHARRHGEAGPLAYDAGGGGGAVRGWLRSDDGADTDAAWEAITAAFSGMFCSGVTGGAEDAGDAVRTFGDLYPPTRDNENATHYLVSTPHLRLCTENLTPFLSLLPPKGVSGLSALLAKPGVVLAWGFKTEGIDVVMPTADEPGMWTGWWEGVVDLVPPGKPGRREFSISSLFQQLVPRRFPAAASSVLRVIRPDSQLREEPRRQRTTERWIDGRKRAVDEWDLNDIDLAGKDIKFWWDGEDVFEHPLSFEPPLVTVSRLATDRVASEAKLVVDITNNANIDRPAVYSEVWPWWVKGWMKDLDISVVGEKGSRKDLLTSLEYSPSLPPTPSTTSLHLGLTLPANRTLRLTIPFTKLTLKYTDHRPDAERGREIPPSVLTLLDVEGEASDDGKLGDVDPRRSARRRVYGAKLLLDIPVPDFSMPYNVIIMTSTVMAVFFGSIQGRLVRRWGWIDTGDDTVDVKPEVDDEDEDASDSETETRKDK